MDIQKTTDIEMSDIKSQFNKKTVMLALSGGVDSSVAVHLLREKGFKVRACVFRMSEAHEKTVEDALIAAEEFNIPITVVDLTERFYQLVILPFKEAYFNGETPNPCIKCNPNVKFFALLKEADKFNCEFVATGHYADIVQKEDIFYIKRGKCEMRDQSYMLYRLNQDVLSRLILPLADYEKDVIRKIAKEKGSHSADKPDSQEICFIPDNDYKGYLEHNFGKSKNGFFIDPDGKKLCQHNGILHYTVGQRKGLGIALGKPAFVKKIDFQSGDIFLSFAGGELAEEITANDLVFNDENFIEKNLEFESFVKIRSVSKLAKAKIKFIDNENVRVVFEKKQKSPAKGQSVVFYINDLVIGGGIISDTF